MKRRKLLGGFLLLTVGISSCINLKSVNTFSSSSLKGIKKFEDINYSFNQHCNERCKFEAISKLEVKKKLECDCSLYKSADSVTILIFNSINGYFDGLAKLSNNELTDYKFDALKKALVKGDFGDVKIEEKHVNAYSEISKILLKATTDAYRKRKLKFYITKANEHIQVLLTSFQFIVQKNLADELEFKKDKLSVFYSNMMDTTLPDIKAKNYTTADKEKAIMEYYQQLEDIELKRQQIIAFAKSLNVIKTGHQKLFDNKDKMTAKEIKELLTGYANDIEDIISEFNKLKK